jgi:hypothetical protein
MDPLLKISSFFLALFLFLLFLFLLLNSPHSICKEGQKPAIALVNGENMTVCVSG